MSKLLSYLTIRNGRIVDSRGKDVFLRGVNLGGWLMMEGYILYGRNIPERAFKRKMAGLLGKEEVRRFTSAFRRFFIDEPDFRKISGLGMNCVRLPFNYKLLKEDIRFLDRVLEWCEKYNIYCILDMHAAPGCQNSDWHADSSGKSYLWDRRRYQKQMFALWEFLADRYKDRDIIAGYDILNEPVVRKRHRVVLRKFYKEVVRHIREIDRRHIIFLEGNMWAQILDDIGLPFAENLCYSIHYYHPIDFTFNFHRMLTYPGLIRRALWNRDRIKRDLEVYSKLSRKWHVPIFVGEFGVNIRCGNCSGSLVWLNDVLDIFNKFNFHWTYWTYKTIANSVFPSGIYQYVLNPPWVGREGPVSGWENLCTLWKHSRREIIKSWDTENFEKSRALVNSLAKFLPI